MAFCRKCGTEEATLSGGMCASCERIFGTASARRFKAKQSLVAVPLGVLLPLFVFFVSAFLAPDSKEGSSLGWLDAFHMGKLALTPIVLWASAALYAVDVCRVADPTRPWIVTGLFLGAVTAGICFWFGVFTLGSLAEVVSPLWLVVPLYVAVWHAVRAVDLGTVARLSPVHYMRALSISLPFWLLGLLWSRRIYEALPDRTGGCFVVTAASRGHLSLVGPFVEVVLDGGIRRANRQLVTLWRFEALWRSHSPRSHARFRRVYNRVGPAVARRITSPWLADLVYVSLKPVEYLAATALRFYVHRQFDSVAAVRRGDPRCATGGSPVA